MLKRPRIWLLSLGVTALSFGYFPLRSAIAKWQNPNPEMIVVLGGGYDREYFAARLAHQYPNLKIWISTGTTEAEKIFQTSGVPQSQVYFDTRATDTVTNFTTIVPDLQRLNVQHVYIVTSDFHLPRSQAISTVVFGSHGIAMTPITVSSTQPRESMIRIVRDVGRSFLWLVTGRTGARFRSWFQ